MKIRILAVLALMLGALTPVAAYAAPAKVANFSLRDGSQSEKLATFSSPTLSGPCAPGAIYESACDVNHDGVVDVFDIQLTAGRWGQTGTWMSDNDHNHLGQTWTGSNNSLKIDGSFGAPNYAALVLSNSNSDGLRIQSAADSGVYVNHSGGDGVAVAEAGAPSGYGYSSAKNGFEVNGAQGNGLFVGQADENGVYVSYANNNGVSVNVTGGDGVAVGEAGDDGVVVYATGAPSALFNSSAKNGFEVNGAQGNGLFVGQADADGVHVHAAGSASVSTSSAQNNGVEIEGAQGNGMYIGRADSDGIRIRSASDDGIQIGEDGAYPYYGLYIPPPGTTGSALLPNTANASGEWALITTDNINAGNVLLSAQTLLAVVGGGQSLAVGEVVTAAGLTNALPGSHNSLAQVQRAGDAGAGVVGVVSSRLVLTPLPGKEGVEELHSVSGPAQPGDYVAIAVLGAAQVKVQDGEVLQPGQRVTVGANGAARALGTFTVQLAGDEGTADITESAPTLGVVLEAPKDGMAWVLVNPQ